MAEGVPVAEASPAPPREAAAPPPPPPGAAAGLGLGALVALPFQVVGLVWAWVAAYGWALVATAVAIHLTSTRVVPKLGARRRELDAERFEVEARARHDAARRKAALEKQAALDVEAAAKAERDEEKRREQALARAASYEARGSVRPARGGQGRRTGDPQGTAVLSFGNVGGGGGGGGGYRPSGPRRPPGGGG